MGEPDRLAAAFGLAIALSLAATPLAQRAAVRLGFLDHPREYRQHARSTPYLGGTAVLAAWAVSAIAFGDLLGRYWPILAGAGLLWAMGTIDDKVALPAGPRILLQVGVALLLWATDLGWDLIAGELPDLALTVLWVVGLTNAANLMDNLDGAAGSSALVAAAGIGALAAGQGEPILGAIALALSGACGGFLPFNLSSPSRIFLGDGGSAPIGFVLAACVMSIPAPHYGWVTVLAAVPLVGVFVLDTTLVVVSRLRRHEPILTGARDHLSHRLLGWLGSPRRVACALAGTQAVLAVIAIILYSVGEAALVAVAVIYLVAAAGLIGALEAAMIATEGSGPRGRATADGS